MAKTICLPHPSWGEGGGEERDTHNSTSTNSANSYYEDHPKSSVASYPEISHKIIQKSLAFKKPVFCLTIMEEVTIASSTVYPTPLAVYVVSAASTLIIMK